jgi:citrate synthase
MDGANAAILLDMGFEQKLIDGFFIIARTPGLVAQAFEEMTSGEGLRRVDESDIEYIGK